MLRTIIVDDEALARRGLKHRLNKVDDLAIVAEARNGREALKAIRELQPDLVFLDIQMPGMGRSRPMRSTTCSSPSKTVACTKH